MKREKHYMIDIETTGVDIKNDQLLEIGIVEIRLCDSIGEGMYWRPTGREYHTIVYSSAQPVSDFAKKHMVDLYRQCNEAPEDRNIFVIGKEVREFTHGDSGQVYPKFFMGWNASNFDMPFMFERHLLTPSYYEFDMTQGKEILKGDAHYRIYEQTGSVQLISDMTGLDRKTIEVLAMDLNPTGLMLPEGKEHDAIYDCYKQIIMQNGLIKIGRMGLQK